MNERLLELKIAYYLNRMSMLTDLRKKEKAVKILSCVVTTVDPSWTIYFNELLEKSINENLLGATKKELYTMFKVCYKKRSLMTKMAGYENPRSFTNNYREYYNKPLDETFMKNLKPVFITDSVKQTMCQVLSSFLDNFEYLDGKSEFQYSNHPRTLELEFWLIYESLINVFQNTMTVDNFIYNFTSIFNLDFFTISSLNRSIVKITRSIPIKSTSQFKQELFNLYYAKGYNVSYVKNHIFKNRINYYSKSYERCIKNILDSPFEFAITYTPTIDWTNLNIEEVMRFIDIFNSLVLINE